MRWPWSPAPFIPDEKPWEERRPWRSLLIGLFVLGGGAALTYGTMLRLDGYGDQLKLHLRPEHVTVVTARVVDTQESPPRLSYAFSYPPRVGKGYVKNVGVPRDVAHRLRPGAKLDVVCLRTDPDVSAPRGQAAIGTRFYLAAGCFWAMFTAVLGLVPVAIGATRRLGDLFGPRPRYYTRRGWFS